MNITVNQRIILITTAILLASSFLSPGSAEKLMHVWGGGAHGWDGWTSTGTAWRSTTRERMNNPFPNLPHVESSETGKGDWRSPIFILRGEMIRFTACGWNGRPGGAGSAFELRRAADGALLRSMNPPQQNEFATLEWYTRDLVGQSVYFEADDECADPGYAWLGLADVREISLGNPKTELRYAVIPVDIGTLGMWGILTHDAVGRPTNPYLSSLLDGESGTGMVKSPPFTIGAPSIRLMLRGWDGVRGDIGMNRIELLDEATGEALASVRPPLSDLPKEVVIDTSALIGRLVCLRFTDGNSGSSFAWMGVDAIDAGEGFSVKFDSKSALKGWRADAAPASTMEQFGIPFLTDQRSTAGSGIKLGFRAERLLLLGMNVPDDSWRWLGDNLGEVRVTYADGKIDRYPCVLGESLWWGKRFYTYPEPFTGFPAARKAFRDSIRLYPHGPVQNGMYIASINLRKDAAVETVDVLPNPETRLSARIYGITAELAADAPGEGFTAVNGGVAPRGMDAFLKSHTLRLAGTDEASALKMIDGLRNIMYSAEANFPKEFPLSIPAGYKGPTIRFEGDSTAQLITNIFNHNAADMTEKVTSDGVYHTSTEGAAWYGYNGFGCFTLNTAQTTRNYAGFYFREAWTRDLGRSLSELTALGYTDKAKACADWCLEMARVWEEGDSPDLLLNGKRLPRHICRILQIPGSAVGMGCFENDGHGLTTIFMYNLWRRLPDRDAWLRSRWRDVKALGDWVVWQLENKDLSKATDVLWSDSEASGWDATTGYSVYCDLAQVEALRGLTVMAESIEQKDVAEKWRLTADGLKSGIEKEYLEIDAKYGKTWTTKFAGWGLASTLGPLILPTDLRGFNSGSNYPEWSAYNTAAYQRVKDGFHLNAMGYGEGFIIQSALLLDKMQEAEALIRLTARAIYNPTHRPYIVPENVAASSDGSTFCRMGDLGNGVQQAEIVKAIRLMAGIDDVNPAQLRIMPRIPKTWHSVSVKEMPVLIEADGAWTTTRISYDLKLTSVSASMRLRSPDALPEIAIRFGPFSPIYKTPEQDRSPAHVYSESISAIYHDPDVEIDGRKAQGWITESGDSCWLWVTVPKGTKSCTLEIKL